MKRSTRQGQSGHISDITKEFRSQIHTSFPSAVVVNFERKPDLAAVFTSDRDVKRIIGELEIKLTQPIRPGETPLFLDEIHECPETIESLRYFYEDVPDMHVIAASSLLEFALQETGAPVGRLEYVWMYNYARGDKQSRFLTAR